MKTLPRILMLVAVASLLMLFLFPMWRITLFAPQYPDGVTMYIWINQITGETPGTLQNINILNHYVGMKYIEPDAIPELVYFPYVIMALAALGLLAALLNKGWGYLSWVLLFVILAALGMYDFYLWEYDYGHNLSPTAPIKIPGASFQPPLFGTKDILNFVAQSYPHTGGYFAGLAALLAAAAWWVKTKTLKS
jgi:copper chaperone NosL